MKVLIACEESQAITIEMRKLGIEAYSCDIQECSGGHPEWHIIGDAIQEAYSGKYDMMIAHPPCTYLSNAGAIHLFPKGVLNQDRYAKGLEGKDFFMKLLNAPIAYIAVENPVPSKIYQLPQYSQIIEPYYFGDPYKKKTCLWLKGLPQLTYSEDSKNNKPAPMYIDKSGRARHFSDGKTKGFNRSKTFPGIAKAIAEQWGNLLINL